MKNNEERKYLINTKYEFSRLTLTSVVDLESAQEFKKEFMQNNREYVVNNADESLIDLNKLIQDNEVAPGIITNFNKQVLYQNNFTDGIIVNEKFVNVLGKCRECIKDINEFIKSDKLIYPNRKEDDLKLIFFDHYDRDYYDSTCVDFYCIKNATEIHKAGCDFILLMDEIYYADNSIDDVCVLFDANIPIKNIKELLSHSNKFEAGAFKNISVYDNAVTFNISEPSKNKSWWIGKILGWFFGFLESSMILLFGLNKKSVIIDDNEFLDMLRKRIAEDKNKAIKETNINEHGLFMTTRENGMSKERCISYKTNQKVANTPKLWKSSEKEEQRKK